mgnify:CR=1 FL=1
MELLDYTGKLNSHVDYLKVMNVLKSRTKYIEIVVLDGRKSNDLLNEFKDNVIFVKKVSKWWNTEIRGTNYLYRLKTSNELFEYLSRFETFCKYFEADEFCGYDRCETTDFGIDDIAFYDDCDLPLLCTTTHEGYILIREDLMG